MLKQNIRIILTGLSSGGTMKTVSGQAELIEKERVRLQINAQVEEFLRRGGAIEVVTINARPAGAVVGSVWDEQGDFTPFSD